MKGMLVELSSASGAPVPNVVAFQFNPETLRHTWTQPASAHGSNPLAVQGMPGESFSFTLSMDVTDQLANLALPAAVTDAVDNGIYSRLAALELLMFPVNPSNALLGAASGGGGERRSVPAAVVPAVLFVWGKSRLLPVRVTSLTITEKLFDKSLSPTHADAQIELRVLTTSELKALTGPLKEIATSAYEIARHGREGLAMLSLNSAPMDTDVQNILRSQLHV